MVQAAGALRGRPLTFREFVTHEEVPLAAVFRAILTFLTGRSDAVVFGAQAANAYCEPARMTQDVDLLSTRAADFAEELSEHLATTLRVATRVREVVPGKGFRIYQLRKPANRRLVDVRQTDARPSSRGLEGVLVIAPPELVAMKIVSLVRRAGQPKAGTDLVDVQRLLLAFPDLKNSLGPVLIRLRQMGATEEVLTRWGEIAASPIEPDVDEGY